MQNGYVQSFHGPMWGELLIDTLFLSMAHARVEIATWVEDYNQDRSHSSLVYETPRSTGLGKPLRLAARQFPVKPPRIDNKPQLGAWVRINFNFGVRVVEPRIF